ncbi:MAG: hypothetical protein WBQ72_14185 [Terriglobales bacterium]
MSPSHIVTRNAGFFTLATWHYMLLQRNLIYTGITPPSGCSC